MNSSKILIKSVADKFPDIKFLSGEQFFWRPEDKTVFYVSGSLSSPAGKAQLLHETAHALLNHYDYSYDAELVQMELKAWEEAKKLATDYNLTLDQNHIEDCLDSYRDWLHKRSTCIHCGQVSLETEPFLYKCFNCQASWQVPNTPLCRRLAVEQTI